ncbi:peptide MFS transporter [Streptomyces virginiae]|uniref:peptide MFS transporter n=1 Tax=Streptomyces virginiae TaxID=1961 RepID=UPI002251735A|nr:peptide MFS transporter [Streptomyces virginiae]MCX5177610.1 peptide MFS transporter [Streptomyces virginiae]
MDEPADPEADRPPPRDDHAFLGHPRGLATLSGLEVWERFSFLGMQAILVLYFADTVANGGLGMAPGTAASVSAAYGTMVYLVSVAGGWLADRILGSYRAVLWGGILIACGHYAMAVPTATMTWIGLGLISAGTGLLKPNVATMVGKLYRTDDDRRDAGFALYYMAINIGAFAGPLVTGWLGEHQGWHWGFSAAAVGMTAGLIQYVLGRRHLAGRKHSAEYALAPDAMRRAVWRIVGSYLLLGLGDVLLETSGMSATSKLAPRAFGSQTMALWFLSLALANGIQAQVVKLYGQVSNPLYFGLNGAVAVAAGVVVMAMAPWLRRTMHPVH